jgi:hypothetical protein
MNKRLWLCAIFLVLTRPFLCQAQKGQPWTVTGANTNSQWESSGPTNYFNNGVVLSNATGLITMDRGWQNELTGEVEAEGDVVILDHGHIWRGTNFLYNLTTGEVHAGTFKSHQGLYMLSGSHLSGTTSNNTFTATNAFISTDDYERPAYRIRARRITIALGQYFEAHEATLLWGNIPVFYFPYYRRTLGQHPNNWEFQPGYRSIFGPYLLSAYNWYGNGILDGTIHADARLDRGLATGPDLNFHLGDWGEAAFRYYYANDQKPNADGIPVPHLGDNRQRGTFYYEVHPMTNMTARVVANYESDPLVRRDFFENEYNTNVTPISFANVNQIWPNYTLDFMAQPRIVNFYDTVERLPELKLTGLRQQVGETPLFYENENSVGWFRHAFSDTNSLYYLTNFTLNPNAIGYRITNTPGHDYSASRIDTFHQFSMPETLFGWLNVTPNIGGRLTYYSAVDGPVAQTNDQARAVFNTGMDINFKASKIYPNAESSFFDIHELRHIMEPEIDYAYVPAPTRSPSQLPQFDYESPSLRLQPIDFPDFNDIDAIGRMNVLRLMLNNKLQTKRADGVQNVVNWSLYTDWNLSHGTNKSWSDFYSDLDLRPRNWLTFYSSTRYDMEANRWREAIERMVIHPSAAWSVAVTYDYLINNDPEFQAYLGQNLPGHNLIIGSMYYKLNENWGVHIAEQYEAQYGGLQQQVYSIYHDLRSWTAALLVRVTQGPGQPTDLTVALTFSLKAFPRYGLGSDSDRLATLYGGPELMDRGAVY